MLSTLTKLQGFLLYGGILRSVGLPVRGIDRRGVLQTMGFVTERRAS